MVWYFHLIKNFPQFFCDPPKHFRVVSNTRVDVFCWNFFAFSMSQWMLAIWYLVPLPLQIPACNIWKFSVHILLKPILKHFEHILVSMWSECNCTVVGKLSGIALLGIGMKSDLFQSCGHCWIFQICWHNECSTWTTSSLRILNSSAGIPSYLALFVIMLPEVHWILHSRLSGSRWLTTALWLSRSVRPFCIVLLCILATCS